jgi:hypothetical protein
VIAWYALDHVSKNDMLRTGIFLSVVQEAVKYTVSGFHQSKLGFPKFVEYIQHVCTGTNLCVARPPGVGAVLSFRENVNHSWEVLPDIESRETHSVENYRSILASGIPMFCLPDETVLISTAEWLATNGRAKDSFGGLLEKVSASLLGASSESVKLALLCFASADVFVKEPDLVPISEQSLRLRQELSDTKMILEQIIIGVEKKLKQSIGDFQRELLEEIISSNIIN